ncbi:DUF4129 domain-containing protein [Gordoniibacillus kamchatkensis]|uniref:DUF4129 domain-containing protein n=1 Tax=Gordoniibacillus kamchatkensis TaxID=1590651 RepID=UPI0018CE7AE4|nr:DUF4129 domain-containing protein [Paenibacillus sp. VKM B-2647]
MLDFERLLRYCKRKGYKRHEHETLRETFARWVKSSRWLAKDLETLLHTFERAKYDKSALNERDYDLAVQTMQRVRAHMK